MAERESGPPEAEQAPLLTMRGIRKSFGPVEVLRGVDLEIGSGEVLALLGENGAGKSTLIKILTGLHQATHGTIAIGGEEVTIASPADAERAGIRVIHQDRHLAGRLTVAEHFFLDSRSGPLFAGARQRREAERQLTELVGLSIHGDTLVDDLTVAEQQLLQLAVAIKSKPRLLVLDEPTAPLAAEQVGLLFETIRALKRQGVALIYISHYLQEVQEISDRVLVLRNGERVGAVTLRGENPATLEHIVELMVGRAVSEFSGARDRLPGAPLLEARGLSAPGRLSDLDLTVHAGEIVGVTGLVGSGVEELADALTGLSPRGGSVRLDGRPTRSPRAFTRLGGAHVPANRRRDGVLLAHTIDENLSLAAPGTVTTRLGLVSGKAERRLGAGIIERLRIRPERGGAALATLSGGNQQKVSVGKWLAADSSLYVLDQPTAGVDIGSRAHIYAEIDRLVSRGAGVLLISLDSEELIGLADRVIVLFRGRAVAQLERDELSADRLLALSTGAGTPRSPQRSGSAHEREETSDEEKGAPT